MADLPERWTYGVRADGRVFFISDSTRTTTWLHPRTGLPVNSGHMIRSDLPRGWEEGFTPDGASYFIDHNERRTTFTHPQTGLTSNENSAFILQELAPQSRAMSKPELSSGGDASVSLSTKMTHGSKVHSFGKRQLSVKRNPNVVVERRGWLYKQDSSGMRLWKRKWFVLSDYCLFYYKDSREQSVLGSIPLPSYEVSPVGAQDHISRKYAFKVRPYIMRTPLDKRSIVIGPFKNNCSVIGQFKRSSSVIGRQAQHSGMRTYFFSAETQDDMNAWITAMNRASRVQDQTRTQVHTKDQTRTQEHTKDQTAIQTRVQTGGQNPPKIVQAEVRNGVGKVHNGVHCGTNTTDRPSDLLDSSRSSEQTLVHEVQLEPVHGVKSPNLVATVTPHLTPPPQDPAPLQSRFNGQDSSPSPILEPNGIAAGTYQTSPSPDTPPGSVYRQATPTVRQTTPTGSAYKLATPTPRQATPPNSSLTRSSVRDQVQNWIKVQRDEHRRSGSRNSLHRVTPPTQFSPIEPPHHYTAPAGRAGEYRYAQDRLSHFGLCDPNAAAPASYWRLYEWQQRHQYRHGNPTAPLYNPAPLHPFGPRPLVTADQSRAPTPRCIEVPPSTVEVPPSLPSAPIGRRPHTPAERLTVRPTNDNAVGGVFTASPRRSQSQFFKVSTLDRRSLPVSGHMTHTVSAPSLHGKTPEELTLLLIQLRRHQSKMVALRRDIHLLSNHKHFLSASPAPRVSPDPCAAQMDESYLQLKKDLEYLDLKIRSLQPLISAVHSLLLHCTAGPPGPLGPPRSPGPPMQAGAAPSLKDNKPVKVAESDIDVKLSRLCEQDKSLKELESRINALTEDKDQLESVLALSHQQMEQFSDPSALQKISLQQKLLQEDLVQLRAQISRAFTDMCHSWEQYVLLEKSVEQLRSALQNHLDLSSTTQSQRSDLKRELWRIEDVLSGLSSSRSHYSNTIQALTNPERTLVPSVQESVPSTAQPQTPAPQRSEEPAPPRPPLPCGFEEDEDSAPEVPPLPREAAVIRHTSVRGLKRQSDERRRDREGGDWKFQSDLRSFLSEPELPVDSTSAQLDPAPTGMSGSSSGLKQSSVSAFVTLRRGAVDRERPKSAFECSASSTALDSDWLSSVQSRGRMSADEQLRRMSRHRRSVGQSDHSSATCIRPDQWSAGYDQEVVHCCMALINQVFDQQHERPMAENKSGEGWDQNVAVQSEDRTRLMGVTEVDVEPQEFSLDISKELSRPEKVHIPERLDQDPEDLTSEELQQREERADRIRNMLTKSGVSVMAVVDFSELDSALLQQQKIMKQASVRGRLLKAKAISEKN